MKTTETTNGSRLTRRAQDGARGLAKAQGTESVPPPVRGGSKSVEDGQQADPPLSAEFEANCARLVEILLPAVERAEARLNEKQSRRGE